MVLSSFEDSIKVLILIGALDEDCKVTSILISIKNGVTKWPEDLNVNLISSLDEYLEKFLDQYKASVQSEALVLLFILVPVNHACVMVNKSIAQLMISQCSRCLVVYGGHFIDSQPNWVFQDGVYAIKDLEYLLMGNESPSATLEHFLEEALKKQSCSKPGVELRLFQDGEEKNTINYFKDLSEFFDFLQILSPDCILPVLKCYYKELSKLSISNHHQRIKMQNCYINIPNALGQYNLSLTIKKEIAQNFHVKPILDKILKYKYPVSTDKSEEKYLLEHFIEQINQNQSLEKLKQHPVFWKEIKKIDYMIKAYKYFKRKSVNETELIELKSFKQLFSDNNEISPNMYGKVYFNKNFNIISKIEHPRIKFEKLNTVKEYLKFIRNRWDHIIDDINNYEKYPEIVDWLGSNPVTFWKNITQPVPQFLLFVYTRFYENIKSCKL